MYAEREGFEPSVQFNPYVSLANWWFQPLTHLSIMKSQRTYPHLVEGVQIYKIPKNTDIFFGKYLQIKILTLSDALIS